MVDDHQLWFRAYADDLVHRTESCDGSASTRRWHAWCGVDAGWDDVSWAGPILPARGVQCPLCVRISPPPRNAPGSSGRRLPASDERTAKQDQDRRLAEQLSQALGRYDDALRSMSRLLKMTGSTDAELVAVARRRVATVPKRVKSSKSHSSSLPESYERGWGRSVRTVSGGLPGLGKRR